MFGSEWCVLEWTSAEAAPLFLYLSALLTSDCAWNGVTSLPLRGQYFVFKKKKEEVSLCQRFLDGFFFFRGSGRVVG